MQAGLRLRLLLWVGSLLIVAFVPLFFAVATYTSVTLRTLREEHALSLGRAVAGHVAEAGRGRSDSELFPLLRAEVGSEGLEAIGVYGPDGLPRARVGATPNPSRASALPSNSRIASSRLSGRRFRSG